MCSEIENPTSLEIVERKPTVCENMKEIAALCIAAYSTVFPVLIGTITAIVLAGWIMLKVLA